MLTISVIGAGNVGSTLGRLLAESGYKQARWPNA
jgi:predicted dinucleotide-binding enzyme